ncbi:MAG: glycosyltransferase family 2 protein [Patescibacteria group bacterium]|nr:MAG: glycosyltransferase family 2 protein [Patescibacteria group bacterium]
MSVPRTAIIVVSWNHGRFLADCFRAVELSGIDPGAATLMIVDNNSPDGSGDFIARELLSPDGRTTKGGFPCVFFKNADNRGFSGGNNQAMRQALDEGYEYMYLLNPDTEAQPGFLEAAIRAMVSDASIGVVQSFLRLHPQTEQVNSYGNEIHFLGFGYAGGESVSVKDPSVQAKLVRRDIAYASGAGMLIRASLLREIGYLDEELFAYHEDLEYSWRARLAGHRVVLAPDSVVFHKYEFSRSIKKYFWMERNRFIVLLRMYRLPTLLLVLPAFLAMELGLWLFALKSGWWREKARAYGYFFSGAHLVALGSARRKAQAWRKITDREATRLFTGRILFQQMQPTLLTRVANPVFAAYWRLARLILWW